MSVFHSLPEQCNPRASHAGYARRFAARLCVLLLLWVGLIQPSAAQQQQKLPPEQLLKAALVEIPTGAVIEVKLKDKQKVRGKLGQLSDADLQIQTLQSGKIETRSIALDQIKSVKAQGKGMSTGAKITLGILAGIGAFFVIIFIVAAAIGWDS